MKLHAGTALLLALGVGSCLVHSAGPRTPTEPPQRLVEGREAGGVRRETAYEVQEDGRRLRDGTERELAADGSLLAERHFARGQPRGTWRTWYPGGAPRSELDLGDGTAPGMHRFWHPNGVLWAEGLAVGEVREGPWRLWDEEGRLVGEGGFHEGRRHGHWTHWEGGRKTAEGEYANGVRVGEWVLWDENGDPHRRGSPPEAQRP